MKIGTIPTEFIEAVNGMISGELPFGVPDGMPVSTQVGVNSILGAIEALAFKAGMKPLIPGKAYEIIPTGDKQTLVRVDGTWETGDGSTISLDFEIDDRLRVELIDASGVSIQDGNPCSLDFCIKKGPVENITKLSQAFSDLSDW